MDEVFDDAVVRQPGELPPDGTYQGIVNRFDFFESKDNDPQEFLKTELKTVDEDGNREYDGWPVETVHCITDPDRLAMVKDHLCSGSGGRRTGASRSSRSTSRTSSTCRSSSPSSRRTRSTRRRASRTATCTSTGARPAVTGAAFAAEPDVPPDQEGLEDTGEAPDRTAAAIAGDDDIPF
jgi:hypothetical protein